jgi:hypothetical protein
MLDNANLEDIEEYLKGEDIVKDIFLPPPTTEPPRPTRTTPKNSGASGSTAVGMNIFTSYTYEYVVPSNLYLTYVSSCVGDTTLEPETTTLIPADMTEYDIAKEQETVLDLFSIMLDTKHLKGPQDPRNVEIRLPLAIVANKIIAGEKANEKKWAAHDKYFPEEEGPYRMVREIRDYMLSWCSAANTSSEHRTNYMDPDTDTFKYYTMGDDFVLNCEKLPPAIFRAEPRLEFPKYDGPEWFLNKDKWHKPKDTFSVPTGMFKDDPNCRDAHVTFYANIYQNLAKIMPKRRGSEMVRPESDNWQVDAKVVVTGARVNVDPLDFDDADLLRVKRCVPDQDYMKDNPVRADLYHFVEEPSRLTRRLLGTWFSDKDRQVGGIEVRHCVWWNDNLGSGGAWDANGCYLVETDAEKTRCECDTFGAMTVVLERTEPIVIEDDCQIMQIIKYVGIAFSVLLLLYLTAVTIVGRGVGDMFHSLRMQVACTWICAIVMHVLTDLDAVRDSKDLNLIFGFIMMYFYTSSCTWMVLEAHATFKAFTGGIISGRGKIYPPFGYGTPFFPLGFLFLLYADDLGADPRCMVAWNRDAKLLYLCYNILVAFIGVIFACIILFNTARPQTKRRSVVADLRSQANGSVAACFGKIIFWILAAVTYLHNQESDSADPYCLFVILLGWFGVILFLFLAIASKKFRAGASALRRKTDDKKSDAAAPVVFDSFAGDDTVTEEIPEDADPDLLSTAEEGENEDDNPEEANEDEEAPPEEEGEGEEDHPEEEEEQAEPEEEAAKLAAEEPQAHDMDEDENP